MLLPLERDEWFNSVIVEEKHAKILGESQIEGR
jgi:hypothetical protein